MHYSPSLSMALLIITTQVYAGPPFMTDDPVPVELEQSEFYLFSTYDQAKDGKSISLPAFEYNYGIFHDTQLHIVIPFNKTILTDGTNEFGLGDTELGIKYRFVHETESIPQIGIFPMAELATGDATRGLGNGKTWWKLPVWVQKSFGEWTTYGGGGYVINRAEGQKNYSFGGWQIQKDLNDKWSLGGEIYARNKTTENGESTVISNIGGYYKFSPDFNLLFSAGHSISGENHLVGYVGLWWLLGAEDTHVQAKRSNPGWAITQFDR